MLRKFIRYKYLIRSFNIVFLILSINTWIRAQKLELKDVIIFAQENSPEALRISTSKENKYWQFRSYKSEFMPQLVLDAIVPSYRNENLGVIQPEGNIEYRKVEQNQAYGVLSLEQNIGVTGGTLYLSSDFNYFRDYDKSYSTYSGSPLFIGFVQPLFSFNSYKWKKKIEPLKYKESQREFTEGKEIIAYNTTLKYFNLLIAQINTQIASLNKANADTIYRIGIEKYNMGKISKNELLQLKFGVISAEKSLLNADLSSKTARLNLCSYTGLDQSDKILLDIPQDVVMLNIDDTLAINQAEKNSLSSLEFKREILEARRDAEEARKDSRLNASLKISYGQTNVSPDFYGIYRDPQSLQTINFGVSVPIMDWGRSKAKRKTSEANLKLVEYTVQQEKINFREEVITTVENLRMLQDFIIFTAEADKTAAERYEIARLRYLAGDISLTEYNIALEQKDLATQDHITALRDYWLTYYTIRVLTLYDFEGEKELIIN